MIIWLVRHGVCKTDVACPWPALVPLTCTGWKQANAIAASCQEIPALVVTSSFLRSQQTAIPLLQKFSIQSQIWPVHEFTYLGRLHGQPLSKLQRLQFVEAYWSQLDPTLTDEAESFVTFMLRIQGIVQRLLSLDKPFIVVFTHEMVIRAIQLVLSSDGALNITPTLMADFRCTLLQEPFPTGTILPIRIQDNRPRGDGLVYH